MNNLNWIDPALGRDDGQKVKSIIKPQGRTKCKNCGTEREFKDIYFDYCKGCVAQAH